MGKAPGFAIHYSKPAFENLDNKKYRETVQVFSP